MSLILLDVYSIIKKTAIFLGLSKRGFELLVQMPHLNI